MAINEARTRDLGMMTPPDDSRRNYATITSRRRLGKPEKPAGLTVSK
jgi:hypothetical protein